MTPKRLVLDTNILLSALVFKTSGAAWVRNAWQSHAVVPLVDRDTLTELCRVLGYPKFSLSEGDVQDLLTAYLPWCETVPIPNQPPALPDCRDPFDLKFLAVALSGRADALVTGDQDLLMLKSIFPIPILTLSELKSDLAK